MFGRSKGGCGDNLIYDVNTDVFSCFSEIMLSFDAFIIPVFFQNNAKKESVTHDLFSCKFLYFSRIEI